MKRETIFYATKNNNVHRPSAYSVFFTHPPDQMGVSRAWKIFLNSCLPFGQVTRKCCLTWALPHLPTVLISFNCYLLNYVLVVLKNPWINVFNPWNWVVCDSLNQSLCWFVDVKFKEYLRSIQAAKTEFSRGIQSKFTLSWTMIWILLFVITNLKLQPQIWNAF